MDTYEKLLMDKSSPIGRTIDSKDDIDKIAVKLYDTMMSIHNGIGKDVVSLERIKAEVKRLSNTYMLFGYYDDLGRLLGAFAFSFVHPWWSKKWCLEEEFIVTLNKKDIGIGRFVLHDLLYLAKANDCQIVETGLAMAEDPRPMTNTYMRHGKFDFMYPNFVKVFND